MHGVHQHKPLSDAAFLDRRLYVTGDVEIGAPRLRLEPELFAIRFHSCWSVGIHSAEPYTQDASRTILSHIIHMLCPPQSLRLRLSPDDKNYPFADIIWPNVAGTIIDTPAQLLTDIPPEELCRLFVTAHDVSIICACKRCFSDIAQRSLKIMSPAATKPDVAVAFLLAYPFGCKALTVRSEERRVGKECRS